MTWQRLVSWEEFSIGNTTQAGKIESIRNQVLFNTPNRQSTRATAHSNCSIPAAVMKRTRCWMRSGPIHWHSSKNSGVWTKGGKGSVCVCGGGGGGGGEANCTQKKDTKKVLLWQQFGNGWPMYSKRKKTGQGQVNEAALATFSSTSLGDDSPVCSLPSCTKHNQHCSHSFCF